MAKRPRPTERGTSGGRTRRPVDDLPVLTNRFAPPATVTPVLVYPDVPAAVAWLEALQHTAAEEWGGKTIAPW